MLIGILILIILCVVEIIIANLVIRDKKDDMLDFYDFYEVKRVNHNR